jgi:NAD(P)-dependent dehydrogenase (short-subunit alcohol dehydrogenase family)
MVMAFAESGADVVIASRKLDNCEEVADEVAAATGRAALAYGVHVGRWDELPGLVDAAYDRFGKVDVLVNNAGMSPVYPTVADVSEKLFDSVMNVNFKGPFRLCALVGPRMAAGDGGSIINVSSTGSIRPYPGITPYAASKAALNTMTHALTRAFGPTVRINTLMAGPFLTDISAAWDMDVMEQGVKAHALQRLGQPEEIVGAALYLASDASSYTSGATLRVDGGIP